MSHAACGVALYSECERYAASGEFGTTMNARTQLLQVFKSRAFSFGDFTLASGKKSSYYVNSKKAIFNSEVVNLLSEVLWEVTRDLNIDAAGGLEVGAVPLTR